ncbi:MAG: hypothetical protein LBE48_00555 [Methanomassiliicoccaceae archaeon]|jgi:hypothetical protein|nr:hypothetical protein [Methanomassiliicoccaceae archaeon]
MDMNEKSRPRLKEKKIMMIAASAVVALFLLASATFLFIDNNNDDDTILGAEASVNITNAMSSESIENAIQGEIYKVAGAGGGNVTVNGERKYVAASSIKTLELAISQNTTVIWKATYTGDISDSLISLIGNGTFVIDKGAVVKGDNEDTIRSYLGNVHVIISGGTVENTRSVGGCAVHYGSGGVTMASGTVKSVAINDHSALYTKEPDAGAVLIKGGTVEATGDEGVAIFCQKGTVGITGGKVASKSGGYAVKIDNGVVAYVNGKVDGMCTVTTQGAVIEIESSVVKRSWDGTSDGLKMVLGRGMVKSDFKWDLSNGKTIVSDKYTLVLDGLSDERNESNMMMMYILVLVIAAVIVAAAAFYFLKIRKKKES